MNIAEQPTAPESQLNPMDPVRSACALIPPLYNLENFVAVNPFLGWSSMQFVEASDRISSGLDTDILPGLDHYRKAWQDRMINSEDIDIAAQRHGLHPDEIFNALSGQNKERPSAVPHGRLASERVFECSGIELTKILRRFVSRCLADVCSNPSIDSGHPITPDKLYQELLERASIDKTFELMGVSGWRSWMKSAPTDYRTAVNWVSPKLSLGPSEAEAYSYRLLCSQYGWASYLRGMGWNSNQNDLAFVEALCAALQIFDLAVAELMLNGPIRYSQPSTSRENTLVRLCLQDAYEDRLMKSQFTNLIVNKREVAQSRADFHVIFCIDVRSEWRAYS